MDSWKKVVIAVVGGLVVVAVAVLAGRVWGTGALQPRLDAAEQRAGASASELTQARAAHATELAALQQSLAAAERRTSLLEARRQVALAIDELDQRNFGLARRHCQRAAETLAALGDGTEGQGLGELTEALRSFQFELDGEFEDSRRVLREHAATLDRALTPDAEAPAPTGA